MAILLFCTRKNALSGHWAQVMCRAMQKQNTKSDSVSSHRAIFGWTLEHISALIPSAMNISLVKTVPQGDFAEISALMQGWEIKFQTLVSQRRPIKYDMYPRPNIPPEIRDRLAQLGYKDLILENDRWQHFLVPSAN
jgi:hypothetical protein